MTTTVTTINPSVSNALTAIYTNNSTKGAVLKSINLNGNIDSSVIRETSTGSSEWQFTGNNLTQFVTPSAKTGTGFGIPYPVQLSDDRLLLLWLPHFTHLQGNNDFFGGNTLHTQIVEFQSNKYVAGAIVNFTLQGTPFNSATYSLWSMPNNMSANYGQPCIKAIALSSTVVVAVIRVNGTAFLYRINITGNYVDVVASNFIDLSAATMLNGTNAYAFDLAPVVGDSTKVILNAMDSGATNNYLLSFNIPVSGSLSLITRYVTGITASAYATAVGNLSKTASGIPVYLVAGATAATTFDYQLFSYNISTGAFNSVGTKNTISSIGTHLYGLKIKSVSTDSTANAVVAYTDSNNAFYYTRQTSLTQATLAFGSNNLQAAGTRSIYDAWNWGDQRVVFVGEGQTIACVNSQGTISTLIAATESTDTTRAQVQWYPFNSRPIYTFYNTIATAICQYYSKTGHTANSTDFGATTYTNNYFPFGHDYGLSSQYNELANCHVVFKGGRIYHLDNTGATLEETHLSNIYPENLPNNYQYNITHLVVSAQGRYSFTYTTRLGYNVSGAYSNFWSQHNVGSNSTSYFAQLNPITALNQLVSKGALAFSVVSTSTYLPVCQLVIDPLASDRVIVLGWGYSAGIRLTYWIIDGTGSTIYNSALTNITGDNVAVSTYSYGIRGNFRLIPDTSYNLTRWRLIGSSAINSQTGFAQLGGTTTSPYDFTALSSLSSSTATLDNNTTGVGYGISSFQSSKQFVAIAPVSSTVIGSISDRALLWYTVNNRLVTGYQGLYISNVNRKFAQVKCSKYGYVVALQNTGTTMNYPTLQVYDLVNINTPRVTYTPTTGSGWLSVLATRNSLYAYSGDVNKTYTMVGTDDNVLFFATINDGTNDFYVTNPNGQQVNTSSTYRAKDNYLIPSGYSLKIRADVPYALSAMVTVVEDN